MYPKETLRVYEEKSASLRSQNDAERTRLFLEVVKPYDMETTPSSYIHSRIAGTHYVG